ncbi:MAG: hypothetical protein N4A35_05550 [Flavobacteriales bacterium]|jgi:hypothetical protein|nr:hypothetical protein [Flavobacteriales bacterium]
MKNFLFVLLILVSITSWGQDTTPQKRKFFFYYGYNWSAYTPSTLQLDGDGYNFTIYDITAKDRPSPFDANTYFNISKLSIPQFNTRIGYQWKEKWALSFGYDHMKYVMNPYQRVAITGSIKSESAGSYRGYYSKGDSITLNKDFLEFEHTDGLNYFTFEIDNVNEVFNFKQGLLLLELRTGVGIGFIVPRTDVKIFSEKGPNIFNFAGYGTSLKTEFRLQFKKHFFLQATGKAGYINLPHISTTRNGDKASQQFGFVEGFWALGTNLFF